MQLQADRRLLTTLFVVIVRACLTIPWAQAAPPQNEPQGSVQPTADLGNPLLLPQDRQQEQWLDSARDALEEEDFGQAVVMLRRIILMDDDAYFAGPDTTTLTSIREQATQLMGKLPVEVRSRLESDLDRNAQETWLTTKQAPSPAALTSFLNRYRMTSLGLEALRLTAATYRDAGHHASATVAWQAVIRHPLATSQQRTTATLALFDSLLSAGDLQSAARIAEGLDPNTASVQIAGRAVGPFEWMQRRLREGQLAKATEQPETDSADPQLPASTPIWSLSLGAIPELQKTAALIQRYYREQGVPSSPILRPIISGNVVLTRTMRELIACDLKSGEQLWAIPNQEYGWLAKPSNFLEASPFRSANASAWYRRTEADSVFASIAAQGKLVIVVQEPDRSLNDFSTSNTQPRLVSTAPAINTRWNKLCGYDLTSRQLVWQMGGPPTGPADVFGGITFLGVPLFVDNLLFVVARREDELVLLAMDQATGHLRWSVSLGVLAPHLADNASRRRIACPVVMSDGLLLCPTAAGMVVAVNPLTRSIAWAYRYPLLQHDLPLRAGTGVPTAVMTDAWWNEWREIGLHRVSAKGDTPASILLASPDTGHLHAVDARSGKELWRAPRGAGLLLAGVWENVAVVIESMAVRGHDLQSGRILWRAETGEISGRGAIAGGFLLQPRRAGGVAAINISNGAQIPGMRAADAVYKSLIPCAEGWIAQTDDDLHRLPLIASIRQAAQAHWEAEPNETTSIELARLDLQMGKPSAARDRLVDINTPGAKTVRHEAILTILRQQSADAKHPISEDARLKQDSLGRELLDLCEDDVGRLIALRALADAAQASGDLSRALTLCLDGLQLAETIGLRYVGYWTADATSARMVRADRVLLGSIQRLLEQARHTDQADQLEQLLNERLQDAKQDDDPFAVQRFLDRILPLEWARRAVLSNETTALYARPPQKADPMILSIAGSQEPETSAKALDLFAKLQSRSGGRLDSEAIQRRMLAMYPGTPLANGQTLAATLASEPDRAETRTHILKPVLDRWPNRAPTVERESVRHQDVYLVPVKVQCSTGSLLDQLDVSVERNGRFVRFAYPGYSGTWDKVLVGAPKVLRSGFANFDQVEAHAIGRLLVLRVGSEVFGVLPFNARGEPRAELTDLRGLDISPDISELPSESGWYQEPVPARLGIRHEGSRLIDSFGRAFGGLSVVRASYICYRSQARLIAVDTQTGKRLWERLDLPPNSHVSGDEDCVYVRRGDDQKMQVISAIDGHLLEEIPWKLSPDQWLMHQGRSIWTIEGKATTTVALNDARTGNRVWSRTFAAEAIPFAMDTTAIGVLERSGVLHLLSAETGAPLGEPLTVECPSRVERIVCLHDAQRWYVAISGPVPKLPILQADQLWGGSRILFVSGWLYGIDRESAAIRWRRQLDAECLPRHVSQVAPTIVQMWRRPASEASGETNVVGLLRVIDKRTGNEIMTHRDTTLYPYSVLNPSEDFESLEIYTERETFRLTYNPGKQDPMQERASDDK